MVNILMSQAMIREAIDLRRLLPFKVPGPDMVSNIMTKNEVAKTYKYQSDMLIGETPWKSLDLLKESYKPVWCKFCHCSDTHSVYDKIEKRWLAVCNIRGCINV